MRFEHAAQVFQAQLQEQPLASYVWDLNDPGAPESTLLPSSQVTALNFNLKVCRSMACAPMPVHCFPQRTVPATCNNTICYRL